VCIDRKLEQRIEAGKLRRDALGQIVYCGRASRAFSPPEIQAGGTRAKRKKKNASEPLEAKQLLSERKPDATSSSTSLGLAGASSTSSCTSSGIGSCTSSCSQLESIIWWLRRYGKAAPQLHKQPPTKNITLIEGGTVP
jgi:hypothetical protein